MDLSPTAVGGRIDIGSPEHKANPFPWYAWLRRNAPVHCITLPDGQMAWLITRYHDVVTVLTDDRFVKTRQNVGGPEQGRHGSDLPAVFTRSILELDKPDHTRVRGILQKAFTPSIVEERRGRVQQVVDRVLEGLRHRPSFDVIRDYALPVSTTLIAEFVGIPEGERHEFQRWTTTERHNFWDNLLEYVPRLIQDRKSRAGNDLLGSFLNTNDAGDRLSETETMAAIGLLLVIGHETTVNLIGNGLLALLVHREQMQRLRNEPELIDLAVEELVRYGSPVETATDRFARETVTIAGVMIPRGALVLASLASANRDSEYFNEPDALDITRDSSKHLGFGIGEHYCLGAPLARLEGRIAISTLVERVRGLKLGVSRRSLRWRRTLVLRGLEMLPVKTSNWT